MNQPFVVKAIKLFAWYGVGSCLLVTPMVIYAFSVPVPNNELARGFRKGFLEAAGFDPIRFSAADASTAIVLALLFTLLYGSILRSISKRQLYLFRFTATILLLAGIAFTLGGSPTVFPIIIGALAWLPPVTRYLETNISETRNEIAPPITGQGIDPHGGRDRVEIAAAPSDKPELPPGEPGANKAPTKAREPWTWQVVAGLIVLIAGLIVALIVVIQILRAIPDIFKYLPVLLHDVLYGVGHFLERLGDKLKNFSS